MFDDELPIAIVCHHGSDEFECPDSAARISDMGINAYPTLIPDGQPEPTYPYSYASLEAVINERMAIDAPGTIGVSGSLVDDELTINVTVEKDASAEMPNARVQVVVTEIDIPYTDPNYNNEMNFVNRDMILDNNGSVLTFAGNTAEATVTGTLDPSWNQDNLIIVVWVEDGSTLEVFQATREDIEMFLADPGAPAIPTDFVTAPDPTGSLSCDLSWTNPTTNFSGNTLTELMEMRLYRDGNLIYTDSSPTIGGSGSYTDAPTESGSYSYMVSGYNSFGEGPSAVSSTWVGEDVPGAVENLLLESLGNQAHITWTNPTTGLNGGAFNNPITGYTIERSDGTIFDLQNLATEYTDATIISGVFYYTVQPYNIIGDGGSATSNSIFFGEGSVFNVFIQCDDYGSETTWDVVDDGGSVLFSGGPYAANEIIDVDCILAAGDYTFTIYDAWGDGICCAYGDGYYTLSLDETIIFEGNGEFLTEESTPFTVEGGVILDPPTNLAVESNIADDFATFTWNAPIVDDITGYNVYLDNVLLGNTMDLQWEYSELINGTLYEAGVVAVYDTGLSDMATLEFTFEGTGADDLPELITALQNNYPNPFNPTTNIAFSLDEAKHVTLDVFNIKGEKVKTLIDSELPAENHNVIWNGTDSNNKIVASGVYFYKMKAGKFVSTKKMILMK